LQKHENERVEQSRRRVWIPHIQPLEDDQKGQITEYAHHKEQLRNEFAVNVDCLFEVAMVEHGQDDAKRHLNHAKNDGHLHLVRIQENERVFRQAQCLPINDGKKDEPDRCRRDKRASEWADSPH
jgi:hypothetical protein